MHEVLTKNCEYIIKDYTKYLGGFWKKFADHIKTVHIKNLSQDFNNCLQKLIKTTDWNGVADIVQYTWIITEKHWYTLLKESHYMHMQGICAPIFLSTLHLQKRLKQDTTSFPVYLFLGRRDGLVTRL